MTNRVSLTYTTDGQRSHVSEVVCAILHWNMGAHWSKMMMLAQSHSHDLSYKTKHCMFGGTHITRANIPGIHTENLRPFITVAMATNCTLNAYNLLKHT